MATLVLGAVGSAVGGALLPGGVSILGTTRSDETPAYRGTAYVVFETMPLAAFGNRLPQLNFEVFRAVDDFEKLVRAVTLIPSAGEFVYEDDSVIRVANGQTISENLHTAQGGTDWKVALNQLEDQLP
jgi:hypothetical protein